MLNRQSARHEAWYMVDAAQHHSIQTGQQRLTMAALDEQAKSQGWVSCWTFGNSRVHP